MSRKLVKVSNFTSVKVQVDSQMDNDRTGSAAEAAGGISVNLNFILKLAARDSKVKCSVRRSRSDHARATGSVVVTGHGVRDVTPQLATAGRASEVLVSQ